MKIFKITLPLLLLAFPALAEPFTYAPEICDFKITFPDKPFIERKCEKEVCHDVVTYTQTNAASSLNFRVTCNKEDADKIKALTPDNLKETLNQMVIDAGLQNLGQDAATMDDIRTSVVIAGGKHGEQDVIYTGQIWLGGKSVLTLEADMTGPANKKIEASYADILKSVTPKNATLGTANPKTETPTPKTTSTAKSSAKKKP